jgi:MoxR-like ATPase
MTDTTLLTDDDATTAAASIHALETALSQVVLGQEHAVRELVVGVLADGHVLLEGVPGVAKTLLARALAASLRLQFARVQFTPDLMPSDLLGTRIYDAASKTWEQHKGPVFTDVLLADELNRTPPKTQAALLEAMQERQVTLDGERHDLGRAFFVIATENPLEFEGTYPLPEAQTDRFLLRIVMGYPSEAAELQLLARGDGHRPHLPEPVLDRAGLLALRDDVDRVRVDESVRAYVLRLVRATRGHPSLKLGASPRAGLLWLRAARAQALAAGRAYVLPDDVKVLARPVLMHRLLLSTEAELDGVSLADVLTRLLDEVPVLP